MLKLSSSSLDWTISHIQKFSDTDIFPKPFEYNAIQYQWDSIGNFLKKQDIYNWVIRPSRRCLSPKYRFGFRPSIQLDPLDTIIFTSLVYEIGEETEKHRISIDERVVHSCRFISDPNFSFFNPSINYDSFQKRSIELSELSRNTYVVIADIADFFPSIYLHPLRNNLSRVTKKEKHIEQLLRFLSNWSYSVSHGLPVGTNAARFLAEVSILDTDRLLLAEGATYCRYMDDYRIFCKNKRDAYRFLAALAEALHEGKQLTLQSQKTEILPIEEFKRRINLQDARRQALRNLKEKYSVFLKDLGFDDFYQSIPYEELLSETQEEIDRLNFEELLLEQIEQNEIDIPKTRFLLRTLGQLDQISCVKIVLKNLDKLYPVFADVIKFLASLRSLKPDEKSKYGKKLLNILYNSIIADIEYHRIWILWLFSFSGEWNHWKKFAKLYNEAKDHWTKRKLIMALGRSRQDFWFRKNRRKFSELSPWERRAFLAAASCMQPDEKKHWYKSIRNNLDELEKTIIAWVSRYPW